MKHRSNGSRSFRRRSVVLAAFPCLAALLLQGCFGFGAGGKIMPAAGIDVPFKTTVERHNPTNVLQYSKAYMSSPEENPVANAPSAMVRVSNKDFLLIRQSGDLELRIERFGDSLNVRWSTPLQVMEDEFPAGFYYYGDKITVITSRFLETDSVQAVARVLDATTGARISEKVLESKPGRLDWLTKDLGKGYGLYYTIFSPDSSRILLYNYDYQHLASDDDHRTIAMNAVVMDSKLNVLQHGRCVFPINNGNRDKFQTVRIDNGGGVYAIGFHTGDTLAVARYDVGSGNVRRWNYLHDRASVGGSKSELHGGIGVYIQASDQVYVAATAEDPDNQRLASVVVVKFDGAKDQPSLVVNNKFEDQLAREMVDEKYFKNYRMHDLKITPGGDYLVFLEQVYDDEYTYRKSIGFQRDNHGNMYGMPGYDYNTPDAHTEVTVPIKVAGPMALFSYDRDGSPKWRNAFKKTQKGPLDAGLTELSYSSLFDHSGNVQLLYLDRANNGLQWGTLQAESGKPGAFRQLMDFGPTAIFMRPATLWLSDDTAIVTGISFSLGAMDLQLFKVKLPLDLTVGGK